MNIQAANQKEVESKALNSPNMHSIKNNPIAPTVSRSNNKSHKITVSYYGEQKSQDSVDEDKENRRIDQSQLVSGSAPLYQ